MKKIVGLLGIVFLLLSCNSDYERVGNKIYFDNQEFTILSNNLILVNATNSPAKVFSKVDYSILRVGGSLKIETEGFVLNYKKGDAPLRERIELQFSRNSETVYASIKNRDVQNLGGVIKSIDRLDGRLEYEQYDTNSKTKPLEIPNGLLSRQGWTVLKRVDGKLRHIDTEGESDELAIFCYGDDYKTALHDFVNLNGQVPLLPKWALGNWYSRYQPLSDQDYKDIVNRFRKEKIPLDVIVPDMNWHIDGWFGTRYDSVKFPDMQGFFDWTHENGLHVGFNHHPGAVIKDDPKARDFLKLANMDYDSLKIKTEKQYEESKWEFIKNALFYGEGNPAHIEPFFDVFLNPIMSEGLDFHWVDGTPSLENLEQYYTLTEKHANKRAIVLTRQKAGSFDHHRFPIGFSADSYISWESLKFTIEQTVMGANVGVYWSHDIGGHMERFPEFDHTELFARWIQSGALSPFNRLHATGGVDWDTRKQHVRKPWEYGEPLLSAARDIMQLKYELMPYSYSLNRKAHDEGLLMCHGMYLDYPQHGNAYKYAASQYMYGPGLLVAPITEPAGDGKGIHGVGFKNVWIPEGVWYDYFDGSKIEGPVETLVGKTISEMPLFVKAGAIIPMSAYMDYTAQKPLDYLKIEFYHSDKAMTNSFNLYEDDGTTLDYKTNEYRTTNIEYIKEASKTILMVHPVEGGFKGAVQNRTLEMVVNHLSSEPESIQLNGQQLEQNQFEFKNGNLSILIENVSVNETISIEIQ